MTGLTTAGSVMTDISDDCAGDGWIVMTDISDDWAGDGRISDD
jgi:hypothetical protein